MVVAAVVWAGASKPAQAVPILQLYLEGGTYDSLTETWVATPAVTSDSIPFRIWAIGNISGEGGKGSILDVHLSAVYDAIVGPLQISLTSTKIGGTGSYNGFTDANAAGTASYIKTVTDGSVPLLGDGSQLPNHGEYGPGRVWQEFNLGNFTDAKDAQTGDFSNGFPVPGTKLGSQINAYDVSVTGFNPDAAPFSIHFDLYDHVGSKTKIKYVFAPFSHDGEVNPQFPDDGGGNNTAPEPGSIGLLMIGGIGLIGSRLRRRKLELA